MLVQCTRYELGIQIHRTRWFFKFKINHSDHIITFALRDLDYGTKTSKIHLYSAFNWLVNYPPPKKKHVQNPTPRTSQPYDQGQLQHEHLQVQRISPFPKLKTPPKLMGFRDFENQISYCWCFRNPKAKHRWDGANTTCKSWDFNYLSLNWCLPRRISGCHQQYSAIGCHPWLPKKPMWINFRGGGFNQPIWKIGPRLNQNGSFPQFSGWK